jgi:hypothetical protein
MDWDWSATVAVTALIVTTIIAIYARAEVKKQYELTKRLHEAKGLFDAFNMLKAPEHRNTRRELYKAYHQYEKDNDLSWLRREEFDELRGDLDVIGILVKSGNIDKKQFLIEFGPMVVMCWIRLKPIVEHERKRRHFDPFLENFQWLSDEAETYWRGRGQELSTVGYDPFEPDGLEAKSK